MTARLLDGKALAARMVEALYPRVKAFRAARGRAPLLAIVSAGEDAAASAYLKAKLAAAAQAGIDTTVLAPFPAGASGVLNRVAQLAADPKVDALVVASPLPTGLSEPALREALPPEKDAEGLSPFHSGRLFLARGFEAARAEGLIMPCAAAGAVLLALESGRSFTGLRAAVIGRSNILGKPAAQMLSGLDATVTLCHSKTVGLPSIIREADLVLACLGRPRFVQGEWIKPGAVVIDAGINSEGGRLCGDVDLEGAARAAAFLSPVPGGVGPVTTAVLLSNALTLAERRAP